MKLRPKAVIINEPFNVSFEELSLTIPHSHDLIVKVELCGICTPEQRVYKGTSNKNYPYWGGHELCGEVIEVVNPASYINPGDKVALTLMDRCGKCNYCLSGLDNHCSYLKQEKAYSDNYSGPRGFSSIISIPQSKAVVIPKSLSSKYAALVEPTACVIRSVKTANPKNKNVGVIGSGTMGLIHCIILGTLGFNVFVFDKRKDDLLKAEKLDIAGAYDLKLLSREHLMQITKSHGISAFFCTRYGKRAIDAAIANINRGGDVILYQSIAEKHKIIVDANLIHYHEINLKGTIAQTKNDFVEAAKYIEKYFQLFECLTIEKLVATDPKTAFEKALELNINRVHLHFD